MYVADLKKRIIHDVSFSRYECQINKIPAEDKKKIFSIQTVKRMVEQDHVPKYNGCPHCMSEYHTFDFQQIFNK